MIVGDFNDKAGSGVEEDKVESYGMAVRNNRGDLLSLASKIICL